MVDDPETSALLLSTPQREERSSSAAPRCASYCWSARARAPVVVTTFVLVVTFAGSSHLLTSRRGSSSDVAAMDSIASNEVAAVSAVFDIGNLTCMNFDDDGLYPSLAHCTVNDLDQCSECTPDTSHTGNASCYSQCGTTCDYAAAGIDDVPDYAVNNSYTMACAWEAVASLSIACGGSFAPSFPASNNYEPAYTSKSEMPVVELDGLQVDDCGLHAFCSSCIATDGTLNQYCAAVAGFYMRGRNESNVDIDHALTALNDEEYWCQSSVLASIESSSFDSSCDEHLHPWEAGHC